MRLPWQKYGWRPTILACLVVAMHLYFFLSALAHRSYLTDDSIQYLTLAENMAVSGTFSQSMYPPLVPDLQRTPGYPVFLLLLGRSPVLVLLVQHLMVVAVAWFIYKAAQQVYGEKVAAAGAKIYLLQPYPVVLASYILSESVFIFLLMGAFWGYLRFWKGKGAVSLGLSLVTLSLAALVRPVALPLLGIGSLLAIAHLYRLHRQRFLQAVVATLVPLLLLGPWYMRNHGLSGRWTYSAMGSMGMVHGRLGGLETWRSGKDMDEHACYMAGDSVAALTVGLPSLRHYPDGKQTHETEELAAGMGGITLTFFLQHPWDAIRFEFWCLVEMFKGVGHGWTKELTHSRGVAAAEAVVQLVCNGLMYLGALLACVRWREWKGTEQITFWAIAVTLMVSAAAWADGRYRMVVDPLLLMLTMFTLRRQDKVRGGGSADGR